MDKDVKTFLKWLASDKEDNYLWTIDESLKDKDQYETLKKIFSPSQAIVIRAIIKQTIHLVEECHNKQNEESHQDIRTKNNMLQKQIKNHRHDNSKLLGGKAEY